MLADLELRMYLDAVGIYPVVLHPHGRVLISATTRGAVLLDACSCPLLLIIEQRQIEQVLSYAKA